MVLKVFPIDLQAARKPCPCRHERDVMRYELAGASIGTWYRGWRFVQEATALAIMVLQQFDALGFSSPLPGSGTPSDSAILADPVSLGRR